LVSQDLGLDWIQPADRGTKYKATNKRTNGEQQETQEQKQMRKDNSRRQTQNQNTGSPVGM